MRALHCPCPLKVRRALLDMHQVVESLEALKTARRLLLRCTAAASALLDLKADLIPARLNSSCVAETSLSAQTRVFVVVVYSQRQAYLGARMSSWAWI